MQQLRCVDLQNRPVLQVQSGGYGVSTELKSMLATQIVSPVASFQIAKMSWSEVVSVGTLSEVGKLSIV